METKNAKGEVIYKFVPTEVAEIWAKTEEVRSDGLHLYQWAETHWTKLDDLDATALALAQLRVEFDPVPWVATMANAKHSVAAAKLYLLETRPMGDHTPHLMIPLLNGYLYLESRNLLDHIKDDYLQHVINAQYNPAAAAPRFQSYLDTALPDPEVQGRVQEFLGSLLVTKDAGALHQQWVGRAAGTLARITRELIGNARVSTDSLTALRVSALFAEGEGYKSTAAKNGVDALVRQSMTDRRSMVNDRYLTPTTIDVSGARVVINEQTVTITDPSNAFWRRWNVVPFIDAPDVTENVTNYELDGVFAWALVGLDRVLERGGFGTRPEGVRALVTIARNDASTLQAWIEARAVRVDQKAKLRKDVIYADYARWCDTQDIRALAANQFWRQLRQVVQGIDVFTKLVSGRQSYVCNLSIGELALVPVAA